jgi:Fe-S-cluster containining protein
VKLVFDTDQRFTCQQCGRCCRRGWDIAVTAGELALYRRTQAARWFRESALAEGGAASDPFEPVPGHEAVHRIRKRADGACGFLSDANRCRIHEELGADKKPLTCRVFPFSFHPVDGSPLVSASFCCPTVVANTGEPLPAQMGELSALQREWAATFPEEPRSCKLALQRGIDATSLARVRGILGELLARPDSLRDNVARIGMLLDDWSRLRVTNLADPAFAEYLELTGGFAVQSPKPPTRRHASRLTRLLFRGFLFAILAARLQLESGKRRGPRLRLRFRLARLLAGAHGLWPAGTDVDFRAARRAAVDWEDPALRTLAQHYLRASIETLGSGRRTLVEELGTSVALLHAAAVLAAVRAGRSGQERVEPAGLAQGLLDASDLTHVDPGTAYGGLLGTLSGGVEACFLFAEGWPYRAADV